MCYAIYIASDTPCQPSSWDESNPGFYLKSLDKREKVVTMHFTKPYVYYAGSHEGCGCGFFTDPEYHDEGDDLEQSRRSISSLVDFLNDLLKSDTEVEMFVCWEGDQKKKPERKLRMRPEDLKSQPLPLQELDWVTITNT